ESTISKGVKNIKQTSYKKILLQGQGQFLAQSSKQYFFYFCDCFGAAFGEKLKDHSDIILRILMTLSMEKIVDYFMTGLSTVKFADLSKDVTIV
ncbi:hypothetical protein MAY13_22970, partial [Escherichia coli]